MASDHESFGPYVYNTSTQIYDLYLTLAKEEPASTLIDYGYPAKPGETVLVYRGYSTKDAPTLGLLPSTVSHAMRLLKAMNAITLLKTGTKSSPSIYLLNYKPTKEQFMEFRGRSDMLGRRIAPNKYESLINDMASLREQMADLQRRMKELEEGKVDRYNL
jgi:hypothetical protein